jgi:aerotaxis receptor
MFLFETEVPEGELIISRTDLKGIITYANHIFCAISGYDDGELIGQPHNIVRHPDMPKEVFRQLWESLKKTGKWEGYVKNLRKDNGYYWVYAIINGVYKDGKLVEYKSLRKPISLEEKIKAQIRYDKIKEEFNEPRRHIEYR